MTDAERNDESELAAWDFRVEQERETFQIYEQRRQAVELQATAITEAALTVAGLLILGQEDLSDLGDGPRWGIPFALAGLLDHGRCDDCAVSRLADAETVGRAEEGAQRSGATQ